MDENMKQNETLTTEDMFKQLEQIIRRMETGSQSLEEAFSDYQKGILLVQKLDESLTGMEKKLEILNKSTGELETDDEGGVDEDEYLPFN